MLYILLGKDARQVYISGPIGEESFGTQYMAPLHPENETEKLLVIVCFVEDDFFGGGSQVRAQGPLNWIERSQMHISLL